MTEEQIEKLVNDINAIAKYGGMGEFPEAGLKYLRLAIREAMLPKINPPPLFKWVPQQGSDQFVPVYQYQEPFWLRPGFRSSPPQTP